MDVTLGATSGKKEEEEEEEEGTDYSFSDKQRPL